MLTLRNFTYASTKFNAFQKSLIHSIEVMTGRVRLWKIYREYQSEYLTTGENFWDASIRKLAVTINYDREKWACVPKTGPLVVVANHPYGVLDGMIITHLMARVRPDFKVLTNSVLCRAPEANAHLLPIDFDGTKEATRTNLNTRKQAREILARGGCITVFPAGGVSTITGWGEKLAQDTAWQPFIAGLILDSKAAVVPVYFEGQNSMLFQCASLLSPTLRLSLFFKEIVDRIGSEIGLKIGDTIPFEELSHLKDRRALCAHLRERTYALGEEC
jgi:putative hemolysin